MSKKLTHTITLALLIVSVGVFYLINKYIHHRITEKTNGTLNSILDNSARINSDLSTEPVIAFRFIKPFSKTEYQEDPASFKLLKTKLTLYIESLKKSGKIISASVYLSYFNNGSNMNLNPEEKYTPGSMFKVINLIYYLKINEQTPGSLENLIYNSIPSNTVKNQTFNSKQIEEDKVYSIRELLKYMIAYSDNRATYLLKRNIDYQIYFKILNDLKIPIPQSENDFMFMTASQYSHIFKILYNSSYLSSENSEYALNLLNQCDFKLGLLNGLPEGINVAHKFGESGTTGQHQLHECGLVYMNHNPYLITIMTKGYNVKDLPPVLSAISKMVYDNISKKEEQ